MPGTRSRTGSEREKKMKRRSWFSMLIVVFTTAGVVTLSAADSRAVMEDVAFKDYVLFKIPAAEVLRIEDGSK